MPMCLRRSAYLQATANFCTLRHVALRIPGAWPLTEMDEARCYRRCTQDVLCVRCYDLTEADLLFLPEGYTTLWTLLPPGQGAGDRVSGSRDKPIGIRADVHDLMQDMAGKLGAWADLVRFERRLAGPHLTLTRHAPAPPRNLDAVRVHTLAAWLLPHHEWLATGPAAVDYGEEIRDLAHQTRRIAGLYPARPEIKHGVPCRHCDALALYIAPGSDWIECGACGNLLSQAEYTEWVGMLAAHERGKAS